MPLTTGSVDLVRFGTTVELIEAAQAVNPELRGFALLTKTRANTASRRDVRGALEETGMLQVLTTEIPLREAIAGAEGTTPTSLDAYDEALDELARLTTKAPR